MILLKQAAVKENLRKTSHHSADTEIYKIATVKICTYKDDEGFYLLYFDDQGNELTDTYHDTMASALEQAEFEFNIKDENWSNCNMKS